MVAGKQTMMSELTRAVGIPHHGHEYAEMIFIGGGGGGGRLNE